MNAALSRVYSILLAVNVRAGMPLDQAGHLAGESVQAIAKSLSGREISIPDYAFNEARRQRDRRVHAMAVDGVPKAQIARRMGLARRTVLNILRRSGYYAEQRMRRQAALSIGNDGGPGD